MPTLKSEDSATSLSDGLRAAVGRLWRQIRTERTPGELTELQYSVLALLVRRGPRTLSQIAEFERVTPTSITRTSERLVELDLATRQSDPGDARVFRLTATPEGVTFVRDVRQTRSQWLQESVSVLSDHDQDVLAEAVPILQQIVDAHCSHGSEVAGQASAARLPAARTSVADQKSGEDR